MKEAEVEYRYGFGIEGVTPGYSFAYDGQPVEMRCFIDNGGSAFEVGICLFINGALQKYYDSATAVNGDSHVFQVREKTRETYDISFVPDRGEAGEVLDMRLVFILNPADRPNAVNYVFGNNTKMNQILPIKLNILKTVEGLQAEELPYVHPHEMTQEEYDARMNYHGQYRNRLSEISYQLLDGQGKEVRTLVSADKQLDFTVEGCGGSAEKYILTAFVNGKAVGYENFGSVYEISEGKFITGSHLSIDLSKLEQEAYNLGQYNSLYILAIPVSGQQRNSAFQVPVVVFEM